MVAINAVSWMEFSVHSHSQEEHTTNSGTAGLDSLDRSSSSAVLKLWFPC